MQVKAPKSMRVRFQKPTLALGARFSAIPQSSLQRDLTRFPSTPKKRSIILAILVSRTANGCPKALAQMERAVYLPTPGSFNSSVSVLGIFPLCFSKII